MAYSQLTGADFALLSVYNNGWLPPTTNPVGSAGNDDITSALEIFGNDGNDRITGTNALLQLINGGAGSDQIYGMGGQDNINGGAGNDLIEAGAGGSASLKEVINGNEGIDTLSYEHSSAAVTIDLRPGTGGNIAMATGGDAAFDTVKATFENFVGSAFNDTVHGTDGVNVLFGLGGADILHGHMGNDTLVGGAGNDQLFGDQGNDILAGGAGADVINGGDGDDTVDYSASSAGVTVDLLSNIFQGGDAQGDTVSNVANINGSAFNDILFSAGAPGGRIYGGGGRDEYRRAIGATVSNGDTFVFKAISDSPTGAGQDANISFNEFISIDLSAIDADGNPANGQQHLMQTQNGSPPMVGEVSWVSTELGIHNVFTVNGGAQGMMTIVARGDYGTGVQLIL